MPPEARYKTMQALGQTLAVLALFAVLFGLAFAVHRLQRVRLFHQVTMGDSYAPFGHDASFALHIANRGHEPLHGLHIQVLWPGMTLSLMGGDKDALSGCQASFAAVPEGGADCSEGLLGAGQVALLMFNARKDAKRGPSFVASTQPLSVKVLGKDFESELVDKLPPS